MEDNFHLLLRSLESEMRARGKSSHRDIVFIGLSLFSAVIEKRAADYDEIARERGNYAAGKTIPPLINNHRAEFHFIDTGNTLRPPDS